MKKILITGAKGLLGKYLIQTAPKNVRMYAITREKLPNQVSPQNTTIEWITADLSDFKKMQTIIRSINPDVIFHSASMGNIDECEKNKKMCLAINTTSTQKIVEVVRSMPKTSLLYISSSVIYDDTDTIQREQTIGKYYNYYAQTKALSEINILQKLKATIIRPATMYGWNNPQGRTNFATYVIQKLTNGEHIYAVTDSHANFLYAGKAAEIIWLLCKKPSAQGIWNLGGNNYISYFAFAQIVATTFHLDISKIHPCLLSDLTLGARRHHHLHISSDKIVRSLNISTGTIYSGLQRMISERDIPFKYTHQ